MEVEIIRRSRNRVVEEEKIDVRGKSSHLKLVVDNTEPKSAPTLVVQQVALCKGGKHFR